MAEITATAVKALRDRTGAGMMDCKRALEEAGGDEERAIDLLRQRGAAKAAKRAGREASEGTVQIAAADDGAAAAIVEVSSETDFVARNEEFVAYAERVAEAVLEAELPAGEPVPGDEFLGRPDAEGMRKRLNELRAKIGENVGVARVARIEAGPDEVLGRYVHFGNRIGVVLVLTGGGDEELARELAMHVAATAPVAVRPEDIPEEMRDRERTVLLEQARSEGKPPEIVEKIVEGRMRKFYEEQVLLWQGFVKDPDRSVKDLLAEAGEGVDVRRFVRFEVGE